MRSLARNKMTGPGRAASAWPVLLVLLAAVLVPSACVAWFMSEAMGNEALAVRQRLRDVYSQKVAAARRALAWDCERRLNRLTEGQHLPAGQRFVLLARESGADSIVVREGGGRVEDASDAAPGSADAAGGRDWGSAEELELEVGDLDLAARAYAGLADRVGGEAGWAGPLTTQAVEAVDGVDRRALALQAQARCLLRASRREEALRVLAELVTDELLAGAIDPLGRLIVPAAQLLRLQLQPDRDGPAFEQMARQLRDRLEDYREPRMPAGQRLFLLESLDEIAPPGLALATLAAERLAAAYLAVEQSAAQPGVLTATRLAGVWQMASEDGSVTSLYRIESLLSQWQDLVLRQEIAGARLLLMPPRDRAGQPEPFLVSAAGEHLPGWTFEVQLAGQEPLTVAAGRKALYLWTGGAGIALIAVLAVALATLVGRQIRLTRLKNDLIATVSHELKTPLASMRMLVDTLLEGRTRDQQQVREYLQLIAKENQRLSRLIDNFLTFSRMERNKRAFHFAMCSIQDIVTDTIDAVRDRFAAPGCRLEVEVAGDLPGVLADRDALVTVLLNLLDNAHKYTADAKCVRVRAWAESGQIVLEVTDNGIGIPRRAQGRIFDRFFQVDQSLSRKAGGCGLGLSIVQFIVAAHGGTVSVSSEVDKGSRFAVRLPHGQGTSHGG